MRSILGRFAASLLLLSLRLGAQAGGVAPEWEIRKNISALAGSVERLKPLLEQVRPEEWVSQGAPDAYIGQWKTIRTEIGYLGISTDTLLRQPDRLTAALDTFFRIDRLQALLDSLEAGIRRYQNPALADLLRGVVSEGAGSRERLRQYVLDLAAIKEQECKVADQEAQRCRLILSRQPPKKAGGNKEEQR